MSIIIIPTPTVSKDGDSTFNNAATDSSTPNQTASFLITLGLQLALGSNPAFDVFMGISVSIDLVDPYHFNQAINRETLDKVMIQRGQAMDKFVKTAKADALATTQKKGKSQKPPWDPAKVEYEADRIVTEFKLHKEMPQPISKCFPNMLNTNKPSLLGAAPVSGCDENYYNAYNKYRKDNADTFKLTDLTNKKAEEAYVKQKRRSLFTSLTLITLSQSSVVQPVFWACVGLIGVLVLGILALIFLL